MFRLLSFFVLDSRAALRRAVRNPYHSFEQAMALRAAPGDLIESNLES